MVVNRVIMVKMMVTTFQTMVIFVDVQDVQDVSQMVTNVCRTFQWTFLQTFRVCSTLVVNRVIMVMVTTFKTMVIFVDVENVQDVSQMVTNVCRTFQLTFLQTFQVISTFEMIKRLVRGIM